MHLRSVACLPEGYPTREHYPFNLAVFQQPTRLTFESPVTIFVGENGSGKSTLLEALTSMAAAGHAQFIMCTHWPILLSCPGATLYSFDSIPIKPVRYEDTEHYKIYRKFIGE